MKLPAKYFYEFPLALENSSFMSFSLFLPHHAIAERDEPKDVCAGRGLQLRLVSERLRTSVAVTKMISIY